MLETLRRAHAATWLVAMAIYGGWFTLTWAHARVPLALLVVLGGITIAWHGSLQHETIHGHPGRWAGWALGVAPLSLWLPYAVYRDTHRRHHATHYLTDPEHDPESPLPVGVALTTRTGRAIAASQRTAVGRMLLGPFFTIAAFLRTELGALAAGTPGRRRAWALHGILVFAVLLWLVAVVHMPLWKYLVAFVYPGSSLTLLRSFAEHRVAAERERRTRVVEAGLFFRLLFLNNNLHVVHHESPHAPWFELPALWEEKRASFTASAPDLVLPGYMTLLREHALRPLPTGEHP